MNSSKSISFYIIMLIIFVRCSSSKNLIENEPSIKYDIHRIVTENLEINQGDVVDFAIEVHNKGQAPIIINAVRSNCGCMIPEWNNQKIPTDEKSKIILKYFSKSKGTKEGNEINYKVWVTINSKEEVIEIKTKVFSE